MIKIEIPEAEAFDRINILTVKINQSVGPNHENLKEQYKSLVLEMKEQIDGKLFDKILESNEWRNLYNKNAEIFKLVDESQKIRMGLAYDTYNANLDRFNWKNKIQEVFFGGKVKEIKI